MLYNSLSFSLKELTFFPQSINGRRLSAKIIVARNACKKCICIWKRKVQNLEKVVFVCAVFVEDVVNSVSDVSLVLGQGQTVSLC